MFSHSLMSAAGAMTLPLVLSACGTPTRQQVGIGTGAVVGGAAVGGVVGNEVTKPNKK